MAPYNNYIIVILDSCRFDSFERAGPKAMARLGEVEQRLVVRLLDSAFAFQSTDRDCCRTPVQEESTRRNTTNAIS